MSSFDTLVFGSESRDKGRYEVLDADGREVASYEHPEPGRSFTANTPNGELLCSGTPRRLKRAYLVRDPAGRTMVTFRNPVLMVRRTFASLADGSRLTLTVKLRTGVWTIEDTARRTLISIHPSGERGQPGPKTVQIDDPRLPLAMLVALVIGHQQHQAGDTLWDYFGDTKP